MRSDIGQKPLHQWDGHEVRSQSVVESGISVPIYTSFIYVNTSNIKKKNLDDLIGTVRKFEMTACGQSVSIPQVSNHHQATTHVWLLSSQYKRAFIVPSQVTNIKSAMYS
jgi:hypothetical protein